MEHSKAIEWIWQRIDGALSAQDESALQAHLDACEDCRKLAEFYQQLDTSVASLEEEPPEGMAQGIMYQIAPEYVAKKTGKRPHHFRFMGTAIGALAAALILLVGTGKLKQDTRPIQHNETRSEPLLVLDNTEDMAESIYSGALSTNTCFVYHTAVALDAEPMQVDTGITDLQSYMAENGLELTDIVDFAGDPNVAYTAIYLPISAQDEAQYDFLASADVCVVIKEEQ